MCVYIIHTYTHMYVYICIYRYMMHIYVHHIYMHIYIYFLCIKQGSIGIIAIEGNKVDRCSTPYLGELLFKVLR